MDKKAMQDAKERRAAKQEASTCVPNPLPRRAESRLLVKCLSTDHLPLLFHHRTFRLDWTLTLLAVQAAGLQPREATKMLEQKVIRRYFRKRDELIRSRREY